MLPRSEVRCDGRASSLHPGRGGAVVPAERTLRPPGRALVPPPSQPGPAQSPQEVPRSQVGEVGEAEDSLGCLAGRGGRWLRAGQDLTQMRSVRFSVIFLRISGVLGAGRALLPPHCPSRFRFLFQLEVHVLPDCFYCRHGCHCGREWGMLGGGSRVFGKVRGEGGHRIWVPPLLTCHHLSAETLVL